MANRARYAKFPAIIGGLRRVEILFVGINPKITERNRRIYPKLTVDERTFAEFSRNQFQGGPYVVLNGQEPHYNLHCRIVGSIFKNSRFEDRAAVTELFLCATKDASTFPAGQSRCADTYFETVVRAVEPEVIVMLGRKVRRYMERRYGIRGTQSRAVVAGKTRTFIHTTHSRFASAQTISAASVLIANALGVTISTPSASAPQASQRFALNQAFPYSAGPGSCKAAILGAVAAFGGPFTSAQFEHMVQAALQWNPVTARFGPSFTTKFSNPPEAARKWLLELLRKERPILIRV
jgi:hypothetical protein